MIARIPLVLDPQPEGGYTVTSPLLPELITEGETVSDALANAENAFAAVMEIYEERLPDWGRARSQDRDPALRRQTAGPRLERVPTDIAPSPGAHVTTGFSRGNAAVPHPQRDSPGVRRGCLARGCSPRGGSGQESTSTRPRKQAYCPDP